MEKTFDNCTFKSESLTIKSTFNVKGHLTTYTVDKGHCSIYSSTIQKFGVSIGWAIDRQIRLTGRNVSKDRDLYSVSIVVTCSHDIVVLRGHKNLTFAHVFKGVIGCDFKFCFLFGVFQAVRAEIRSLKLQRLKSQTKRDILYKS